MLVVAVKSGVPLGAIPFATSIALVAGAPESASTSTRAIFVGHSLSALVGFGAVTCFGGGIAVSSLAVGLAVGGMMGVRAFHPPAAISPLIIVQTSPGVEFLYPIVIGAALVAVLARVSAAAHRNAHVISFLKLK